MTPIPHEEGDCTGGWITPPRSAPARAARTAPARPPPGSRRRSGPRGPETSLARRPAETSARGACPARGGRNAAARRRPPGRGGLPGRTRRWAGRRPGGLYLQRVACLASGRPPTARRATMVGWLPSRGHSAGSVVAGAPSASARDRPARAADCQVILHRDVYFKIFYVFSIWYDAKHKLTVPLSTGKELLASGSTTAIAGLDDAEPSPRPIGPRGRCSAGRRSSPPRGSAGDAGAGDVCASGGSATEERWPVGPWGALLLFRDFWLRWPRFLLSDLRFEFFPPSRSPPRRHCLPIFKIFKRCCCPMWIVRPFRLH